MAADKQAYNPYITKIHMLIREQAKIEYERINYKDKESNAKIKDIENQISVLREQARKYMEELNVAVPKV